MLRMSLALSAIAVGVLAATPACADDQSLRNELAELRAQVGALKAEVDQLRAAPASVASGAVTSGPGAPDATRAPDVVAIASASPVAAESADATRFWGYGELNYTRPTANASAAQADLRRAVLGFSHAFDADTHVYGELEWEHAVVSADDVGESEIEQLYVEHQLRPELAVRAGLSLIPLGLLNEHHEPGNYYGVERNFVETAIIPSTWREGGISVLGTTEAGLSWNVGVTTGFDLSKWDSTSGDGRESPLGSIHQELQLAKAHDPSVYAAANWQGIPGLTLGGGVFTGGVGQGQEFPARDARLVLGEVHARWQPGPFDVSALYARGHISDTEALNLSLLGAPTPVPESFWGGYVQGAWRVWQRGDSSLAPFVRVEAFNTAAAYAPMPPGLGVPTAPTERVWTVGMNYWLTPGVVFKLDYQDFNVDASGNRFNLGVGYQF